MTVPKVESKTVGLCAEIGRLYEAGRYLSAYRMAEGEGILRVTGDTDPDTALLAAKLMAQVGGPRRGRLLDLRVWRRHRAHPPACVRCAFHLMGEGALRVLDFIERVGDLAGAAPLERAHWLGARALQFALLRDFQAADAAWSEAVEHSADPWTWCMRAMIEDRRDRPEEARAAVAESRAQSGWYRPAVELEAHLLLRTRRFAAARELLEEASRHLESTSLLLRLHTLCVEDGDLDRALECLLGAVRMAPMMERELHDQLIHCLSRVHYLRGERQLSVQLGRLSSSPRMQLHVGRLEKAAGPVERVLLPVPQIPQHHLTCSPATLTSIAELWGEPVEHLELAEEICHDGTPAVSERRWATGRGFTVREFTVTWEAATALIDAAVPFTLGTVFTSAAHCQAVVGYDRSIRALLVRDPSSLTLQEFDWDQLAEAQAAFGPRGMLFVPAARRDAIDEIDLPDARLFDHHFAVEDALRRHDRRAAQAAYDELIHAAPHHRLRYQARRALASYDGDGHGVLEWADAMLAATPDDARLLLRKLGCMRGLDSRAARLEVAARLLIKHDGDPAVLAACAEVHAETGDGTERAHALARRAVRAAPSHEGFRTLAALLWSAGERRAAGRLFRFASCLAETDEAAAWSYFLAARSTGATSEALAHLRARVDAMAARSAKPAQTLCEAYVAQGRTREAFDILERTLADHPDDGALLLVASEQYRLAGKVDRAEALLERARGRFNERSWRRSAAALSAHKGDMEEAFALLREIVAEAPLDVSSQAEFVQHLARGGAVDEALRHLEAVCAAFPFHLPLHQLRCDMLARHAPEQVRPVLESFLERHPGSEWAVRQLALIVAAAGDVAAGRALLDRAAGAQDARASLVCARAALCKLDGQRDRARELYRAAVAIDVDEEGAVDGQLDLAGDSRQATLELDLVAREIERQGSRGPGLCSYADGARRWLDRKSSLERLVGLRARHADLWQAWSAELHARMDAGELERAAELAGEAVERFEMEPGAWLELAMVQGRRGDRTAQVAAAERAVEISPRWLHGLRILSEALEAAGEPRRAREVLERALAIDPFAAANHGYLADLRWNLGEKDAARDGIRHALRLDPSYGWAWHKLMAWSSEAEAIELARALVERAPAAVRPRVILAELDVAMPLDERVRHLDEVIRRVPEDVEVSDTKAVILAESGRWEEALAACRPPLWGDQPPVTLRGRAAWIRQRRGDGRAAWNDMLAAIASSPGYQWGVQHLVEWAADEGEAEYLEMAQRIVEVAPDLALAHAHLGEASRVYGHRHTAEESFRRALQLDPTHRLARLGMFDVHEGRGELDAARPYLDGLNGDDPWVMARRIRLEVRSGDTGAADELLRRLLHTEGAGSTPVEEAMSGYERAGLSRHARRVIDDMMDGPDVREPAGWAWWDTVAAHRSRWWRWRRIRGMPPSEARAWCASRHVEEFGKRGHRVRFFFLLALNWRWMRAQTGLWGSAGYCLVVFRLARAARWWLSDFRERQGVLPWMLLNLVRAMMSLGQVRSAWTVCREASGLPSDHTAFMHELISAVPRAVEGQLDEATRAVALARPAARNREARFVAGLAEAVIAFRRDDLPIAERRSHFAEAVSRLWSDYPFHEATDLCRKHYRDTVWLLREDDEDGARHWRELTRLPSLLS
ncbi:MAG TPA: tetratricopeptide repeat protein [Kofleriaceae bacterium]|nr:tetratricopeptide repeat protein [Kofleriaceae bacterium]